MQRTEETIEVNVPVKTAYNQWTQFESFPEFMEGVKEVRQIDDRRVEWHAEIGGKDERWQAEIYRQVPDKEIAWRSTSGTQNQGMVRFEPRDANKTLVRLTMEYEPEGAVENVGDALGVVKARIQGDLKRFKAFIESRGVETGKWRGEIQSGRVEKGTSRTTTSATTTGTSLSGSTTGGEGGNFRRRSR